MRITRPPLDQPTHPQQATAAAYERENNLLSTQLVEGIQQLTDAHRQASLLRDENARLKEELANVRDATDAATVKRPPLNRTGVSLLVAL